MTASTRMVRLPGYFWLDHHDRGLPSGKLIKNTGRQVWVEVTEAELREIYDDASHYADSFGFEPEIQRSVCQWAKSMVKAIERIGVPEANP